MQELLCGKLDDNIENKVLVIERMSGMFCRECGSALPEGGKFCPECGTKVEIENVTDAEAMGSTFMDLIEMEEEKEIEYNPAVPAYRCKKCNGKVNNLPEKPAKVCEFCGSKNLEPMTMEEFMKPVSDFNKKWSERFDSLK